MKEGTKNKKDDLFSGRTFQVEDFSEPYNIKNEVITLIDHFMEEMQNLYSHISEKASEHIHAKYFPQKEIFFFFPLIPKIETNESEVILTIGKSKTVEHFLVAAARKRQFEVIVAESAPKGVGKLMATELANNKIKTTIISDAAIFAIMARVNKVIIGVHAVLANGGLLACTGAAMLCSAAKYHNVPVVALVPLYKLTPLFPNENQDTFNDLNSPAQVLPFEEADSKGDVVVKNPGFDYVSPENVNLFITNSPAGGHNPSYIYRLLAEFYHPDDATL